jgi:TonB family protein
MKAIRRIPSSLLASIVLPLLPHSVSVLRPAVIGLHAQDGGAGGAPVGKLNVPARVMAGLCMTMVSPMYPATAGDSPKAATVKVRVVIWKSGSVSPMRVVSGDPSFEVAAMNAVRLWRYKPYFRDGEAVDVTTEVEVDFVPGRPGGIVTHPKG